jgi:hypothetical protein
MTGQGSLLQPNQLSGTYTFNYCLTGCGLSSNPYTLVQLNETRNMLVEITSVNGLPTDDFIGNNTDILPITRIPCTQSTNGTEEISTEQPIIKIYTITGMLVDGNKIEYLSSGMYVIHYQYSDHTDIEKIIK